MKPYIPTSNKNANVTFLSLPNTMPMNIYTFDSYKCDNARLVAEFTDRKVATQKLSVKVDASKSMILTFRSGLEGSNKSYKYYTTVEFYPEANKNYIFELGSSLRIKPTFWTFRESRKVKGELLQPKKVCKW